MGTPAYKKTHYYSSFSKYEGFNRLEKEEDDNYDDDGKYEFLY
jgi:hypothetical protein